MTEDLGHPLGHVGVWTFAFDGQPSSRVREAAAEIEELGYGAIWCGEGFGRDAVSQAWLLLSATRRVTVASGIANIAFRDPIALAGAARALGETFPGRYLLGLGGHRVDDTTHLLDGYPVPGLGRAVSTMGAYLAAMDAVPAHSPSPATSPRHPTRRRTCGGWASVMTTSSAARAAGWSTRSSPTATPGQSGTGYVSTSTPAPTTSVSRSSPSTRPCCQTVNGVSSPQPCATPPHEAQLKRTAGAGLDPATE